jgi:hypothetical protein
VPHCKLCQQERPLIRSHIIPDAFHRDIKGDHPKAPLMIGNDPEQHPKRRPGGLYDEELVCEPCERLFSPWDDYAAEFFLKHLRENGQPMKASNGELIGYRYDNVDYKKLKLFVVSLLWRAAASSNEFFDRVELGPHEERARSLIVAGDPGTPHEFSVLIERWYAPPERQGLLRAQFSPYCAEIDDVHEVKLFLAGAVIHVKVDKRPYPEPFPELMLRPGVPLHVISRELEGSKDLLALRPALDAHVARLRR